MEYVNWFNEWRFLNRPISVTNHDYIVTESKASYIENETGQIYESTLSPSRNAKTDFIDGNKYDFYETFSMTKYDATDKIKVVLYYYGNPVNIELEKIHN